PEPHRVNSGIGIDPRQQHFRRGLPRQAVRARSLERFAAQHVHHALCWHADVDTHLNLKLFGAAWTAVVQHGIGGENVVRDAGARAVFHGEEGAAPAQPAHATYDIGLVRYLDGDPVADPAGILVVHRQAREHVLDIGLQRDADGRGHADACRGDAGQREAFLPPQTDGDAYRDDEDRHQVLQQAGRFAAAAALDVAFPIEAPSQTVDEHRDANDQRDGDEAFDTVDMLRRIMPDQRLTENPHHQQQERDDGCNDHYFSVITRSTPRNPSRRRRRWKRTHGSPGDS